MVRSAVERWSRRTLDLARRIGDRDQTAFVSLRRSTNPRGHALLAYIVEPFLDRRAPLPTSHAHFSESVTMAETLLDLGFAVDVISYRNTSFVPKRPYRLLLSARTNFSRLAGRLGPDCIKVVALDTSHWLFNNTAAVARCLDVQRRRGVTLASYKHLEQSWALEDADCATMLGNETTYATYAYAKRAIYRLPNHAIALHPSPATKDVDAARRTFVWLGSRGFVHKGLDLVLEAFTGLPDHRLVVCGPVAEERRFVEAFRRELYETPNVETLGWIDVASPAFDDLAARSIALVYPSCAEGSAGSVVTAMHGGLIPIASRESGVDVDHAYGRLLPDLTVASIQRAVHEISRLPTETLRAMAVRAWTTARATSSKEAYAAAFRVVVEDILAHAGSWRPGFIDLTQVHGDRGGDEVLAQPT